MILLKILLLFAIHPISSAQQNTTKKDLNLNITLRYYELRNINNVIIFNCWTNSQSENVNIIKKFSYNNIQLIMLNINNKRSHRSIENIFRIQSKIGIVYDFCCRDAKLPFLQDYPYFNSTYIWLMFNCENFDNSLFYLKSLPLNIRTDMVLLNVSSDQIDFYDIYHTGYDRNGFFNVTHIGNTSILHNDFKNEDLRMFFMKPNTLRRNNLNGLMMRAVTLTENNKNNMDTHEYLVDERQKYTDSIFMMNYQMVLILKRMYNFSITFVLANNWSDKNSKGFYKSGNLLGLIGSGKADIMAGALQLVKDRLEISDVLYLTYPFRCGFIFRYQGDFGENKSSFLTPFTGVVWFSFLSIIIIVMLIIWCILSFENKYIIDANRTIWNFSDSILSVIGACCQMGSEVTPITSSSRIIYFIFFFTSLIMYNFYTSSIVSSLLNFGSETFTIVDLANSPLKCGSLDIGYVHNLLFDTPVYPNLDYFNKKKKTKDFYFTLKDGIAKVKLGGFSYHAEYNTIYHLIENTFEATEICELKEIGTIPSSKLGILGMKYSSYSELFRVGLTKASETGHLKRLLLKWVARKPLCQASKSFTEVNLPQITPSHVVLYIGFVLSVLILIIEIMVSLFFSNNQHLEELIVKNRINFFIKVNQKVKNYK